MGNQAARITDMVAHPVIGKLLPGPGSMNVIIGNLPAWRGLPAAAAAALQAAKAVSDAVVTAAEVAKAAAMGTPAAPAAIAAEQAAKAAATAALSSMMNGLGAACAALGGTPDTHICATPPVPPPPHGPGMVIDGSPTVLVNGLPACAVGDHVLEALGPLDPIILACPTVYVGKQGGAGAGGGIGALIAAVVAGAVSQVKSLLDNIVDGVKAIVAFAQALANKVIDGLMALADRVARAIIDGMVDAVKKVAEGIEKAVKAGDNSPPGAVYATPEEAAKAALAQANPDSIMENLEYGGMIYKAPNGKYGFSGPAKGTDAGFNPSDAPVPAGTTPAGDYHTHADYSVKDPATGKAVRTSDPARDDYNSDQFSRTDRRGIANDAAGNPGYKGYLGTPSGKFYQYDPSSDTVSEL